MTNRKENTIIERSRTSTRTLPIVDNQSLIFSVQNDPELRFWQSLTSLVRTQVESDAQDRTALGPEELPGASPTPPSTPPTPRSTCVAAHQHSIEQILAHQTHTRESPFREFPGPSAAPSPAESYLCSAPPFEALPIPIQCPYGIATAAPHVSSVLESPLSTGMSTGDDTCELLDDACDAAGRARWTLARLLLDPHARYQ